MTCIAFDFGTKRIGVAVEKEGIAFPRESIAGGRSAAQRAAALAAEQSATRVVVGLPKSFEKAPSSTEIRARAFARHLTRELQNIGSAATVHLFDERLTSRAAARSAEAMGLTEAQMRGQLDGASAALILADFLGRADSVVTK